MSQPFDNRDWDVLQIQEKEAEINRLREQLRLAQLDNNILENSALERSSLNQALEAIRTELECRIRHLEEALQRQDNAIIEFRALLIRAADALEYYLVDDLQAKDNPDWQLLDELRKAADAA